MNVLPIAASYRAGVHMHAGEYAAAANLMEESAAIAEATGAAPLLVTLPMLAAYRGHEAETLDLIDAARGEAAPRGQALALSMIECAHAVLLNGLGRYDEALGVAEDTCAHDDVSVFAQGWIEVIEAASRTGQPERASAALERLTERTQASGTDWALGLEARSRALLTADHAAEPLYEESVDRLARGRLAPHLARAQLVYGEWLRRQNRRVDAREQLRAAYDTFSNIGNEAFAERARRELAATGETVRKRTVDTRDVLTAQEAQIARLASERHTNPEIGAQLFISPRTVEYHLAKVFTKLGISSRKELLDALGRSDHLGSPG